MPDRTLVPSLLKGIRGDLALRMTIARTQQLLTNSLKTLQHINIRKTENLQSIPLENPCSFRIILFPLFGKMTLAINLNYLS
jgi:hypothetical protein